MKTAGIGGAALLTTPLIIDQTNEIMRTKQDYSHTFGMARSLKEEYDYEPIIEGNIPEEISGTLYRNGPGLFERNGYRKNNVLDGDGMIQAFHFQNGKVNYLNRFVRTQKWMNEEKAEKYLYNTWTTRRPGGMLKNAFLQGEFKGQAGVTVRVINGKLYAFDESSLPYELDPQTLETLRGELDFGVHFENVNTLFAAHSKVDGVTGDWIQFGLENGPKANIQVSIFDSNTQLKRFKRYELPLGTYMHDFFVSENYIIFNLQPAVMNPLKFILGMVSYAGSLRWKANKGSTFMVIHKSLQEDPIYLKTDAVWMWHSLNTFEKGDEIIGYFVGYDEPDHFIGNHAQLNKIMTFETPPESLPKASSPGTIRMIRINPKTKKITQEILNDDTDKTYEFPILNQQFSGYSNVFGYFAYGDLMGVFHNGITRRNFKTGKTETYKFGFGQYVGEPIFVPIRNHHYTIGSMSEPGWLMSLVYDEHTDKSFIAILNAESVQNGPIAKIHLEHHSPMSFHGFWKNN